MSVATAEEYRELEQLYASRPAAYRRKVMGLIGIGYFYVLALIVVIAGFVIGGTLLFVTGTLSVLWIDNFAKIAIPALLVAGLMAKALFVRIPKPEGMYLDGELKQRVLEYFEPVRQSVGGKHIDNVVITSEFNAAVQQLPRFGLFGPTTNYLILGVPLLQLMNTDEVRAVIAHEFGHLSHEHGRMGGMVYRLNHTLYEAANAINEKTKSGLTGWSYKFFYWFFNRFDTVTFAMRRGQEYEADAAAVQATSANAIASALCRMHALSTPINSYWGDVWDAPRRSPDNRSIKPHTAMRELVAKKLDGQQATADVQAGMVEQTGYSDTHPCLRDRLSAIGISPVTDFDLNASAIFDLFPGGLHSQFLTMADELWHAESKAGWADAHEQFTNSESAMASLRERVDSLDFAELLNLANLEEQLDGQDASRATYRLLVDRHTDNAIAQFHWGRVNLTHDFSTAETALTKSANLDMELVGDIAPMLEFGYTKAGQPEGFASFKSLLDQYSAKSDAANAERESVNVNDDLVAVDMGDEFRNSFINFLSEFSELKAVYLVQKRVKHFQDNPVYLLGLDVNTWHDDVESDVQQWGNRISDKINATFPSLNSPFWTIVVKKSNWASKLSSIEGALIHQGNGKADRSLWSRFRAGYGLLIVAALVYFLAKEYLLK